MKKIISLTSMLAVLFTFAAISQAIEIKPGDFGMKYTDYTYADFNWNTVTNGGIPVLAPGQIAGTTPTGNVWGIFSLTGIHTLTDNNVENNSLSGVSYYNPGDDGKYYFGVYGGLTYMSGNAPGEVRLGAATSISPYLMVFETTNPTIYDLAAAVGPQVTGAGAFGTFGQKIIYGADGVAGGVGVNADSTLFLNTVFAQNTMSAYDTSYQAGELELATFSSSVTGSAEAYLDIIGGTGANLFEKGIFDLAGTLVGNDRADLKIISDLTNQYAGLTQTWTNPFGWTTNSQDPITGSGSNPVPEPSTIILLGAGLLGIGIFGKRRMKL